MGGILDTILNRLAGYIEKRVKLARQVRGALVYPVAILLVAIIGVAVYLYFASPLLMNPVETASLLQAERVPPPTMAEMVNRVAIP